MSMMMSQILKFVDSPETRKTKYFENETSHFLHIKKFHLLYIHSIHSLFHFLAEVTLKLWFDKIWKYLFRH